MAARIPHRDIPFSVPFLHRLRFTQDVLGAEQHLLADVFESPLGSAARVQFWIDRNVAEGQPRLLGQIEDFAEQHGDRISLERPLQLVDGGESIKNEPQGLWRILQAMHAANLDRRSYVVVIGGGAVLDALGFAATIAHRGIRLVRLPSSTMGQGDSGVGVKNGINLFQKKNWLGAFAVPWAVINDARLLTSLSDRDFVCGFSESVKVALLKDAGLFDQLCQAARRVRLREMDAAWPILRRSAELHREHITLGGDPFELSQARPLDFGHWSAHKLESMSDYRLRHGEAVAIGVAIDTVYSSLAHGLARPVTRRVLTCLCELGIPLTDPLLADSHTLFDGLEEFRQHLGGELTLTMLSAVGKSVDVHHIDRAKMRQAIQQVADFVA